MNRVTNRLLIHPSSSRFRPPNRSKSTLARNHLGTPVKNSPNTSAVFNLATTPAGSLSLALCVALASQGAWSATCPTRPACNVSQNNFSGNLAAGQSLCITGSFTGNINNLAAGATIYVPAGATFNPASLQNPAGSIINCGTATLPSITLNTGFNFSNHGTADFRSNINWNGKGTFLTTPVRA